MDISLDFVMSVPNIVYCLVLFFLVQSPECLYSIYGPVRHLIAINMNEKYLVYFLLFPAKVW